MPKYKRILPVRKQYYDIKRDHATREIVKTKKEILMIRRSNARKRKKET